MGNKNLSSRNGQFKEFKEKTVFNDSDILLIEDSSDGGSKKALPLSVLRAVNSELDLGTLDSLKNLSEESSLLVQVDNNKYSVKVKDLIDYVRPKPVKTEVITTDIPLTSNAVNIVIDKLPSSSVYVKELKFYISDSYGKSLDSYVRMAIYTDRHFLEHSILREYYGMVGCSFLKNKIQAPVSKFTLVEDVGFQSSSWIGIQGHGLTYKYRCHTINNGVVSSAVDLNFNKGALVSSIITLSDFTYRNSLELNDLYLKLEILDGSLEPRDFKIETTVLPFGG